MKIKKLKLLIILAVCAVISACGGHSFEGKYSQSTGNKIADGLLGGAEFVIGPDYVIKDGDRRKMKDIFVRKEDGVEYLVFVTEEGREQSLEIIDANTLVMKTGTSINLKLSRI